MVEERGEMLLTKKEQEKALKTIASAIDELKTKIIEEKNCEVDIALMLAAIQTLVAVQTKLKYSATEADEDERW